MFNPATEKSWGHDGKERHVQASGIGKSLDIHAEAIDVAPERTQSALPVSERMQGNPVRGGGSGSGQDVADADRRSADSAVRCGSHADARGLYFGWFTC